MLPRFTAANALIPFGGIVTNKASSQLLGISYTFCDPPCPEGTLCTDDIGFGTPWNVGVCCAPGEVACRGRCYPACPGKQRMERVNCTCYCPGFYHPNVYPVTMECGEGTILNTDTCRCECRPDLCPDYRMVQKLRTRVVGDITVFRCVCECPPGLTDCYGYCADLTNDPLFCGSCDAMPCDSFSEKCCNGTCTNICNDTNCGDCGRAVQAGEKCCNCTSTKLGTNTNCSDCGDICTGGRTCVNGNCQCPPGTRECSSDSDKPCCPNARDCCNETCCATGTKCCNGTCVNLNTDVNNCGGCGNVCAQGASCVRGQCQCPPNRIVCNYPTAMCLDNMTPGAGPNNQWQVTWRTQNPGVPFFTCPPPNQTLVCAQGLVRLPIPNTNPPLSGCCPTGSTWIDAQGNCR